MSADTHAVGFDASQPDRPRGWRDRMRSWFAPYEEIPMTPLVTQRELTCRQEPREPIPVLGEGDAFHFQVFPTYEWRATVVSQEEIEERAAQLRADARRVAVHLLRPVARTFPPHRARELEEEINKRTDHEVWKIMQDGDPFRLSINVRVIPDEQIQDQLKPYWEERIKAECAHQLGLQRAQQVDELTRRWSGVLDRLDKDPRTIHAARLTEKDFAGVFGDFVKGRQEGVNALVDLLQKAVYTNHEVGLGPSEFTRAWDEALNALRRQNDPDGPPKR